MLVVHSPRFPERASIPLLYGEVDDICHVVDREALLGARARFCVQDRVKIKRLFVEPDW